MRKTNRPHLVAVPRSGADREDEDFLDMIADRLPESDRRIMEVMERVKSVYVPCRRDKLIADQFSDFMTHVLARRDGARDDGRVFFLTGESGAGKTQIVRRVLRGHPALQPVTRSFGQVHPLLSITLSGPSTLKWLGLQIFESGGYAPTKKYEQGEVWHVLPEQLHHRKVLVIHIDETQHMVKLASTDRERDAVAKAFKGVMNAMPWPVSFVMTGMPETVALAALDEQIERRAYFATLTDVELPSQRKLIENIVRQMCEAAGLDAQSTLASDLPERIAHAARYRYGRIAQVTLAAIGKAVKRSSSRLERDDFAYAYLDHSHARGMDRANLFLADNWASLQPGSFLLQGDDE